MALKYPPAEPLDDGAGVAVDVCALCGLAQRDHGPKGKCLFEASQFLAIELTSEEYTRYRALWAEGYSEVGAIQVIYKDRTET